MGKQRRNAVETTEAWGPQAGNSTHTRAPHVTPNITNSSHCSYYYSVPSAMSSTPDRRGRSDISAEGKDNDAATYSPASLAGHISVKDMGTRTQTPAAAVPAAAAESARSENRGVSENYGDFAADFALENIAYRPTTGANARAFELLTISVRQLIPDEPHSVIFSAADAVLETLKGDGRVAEKKREIEQLLGLALDDAHLTELVGRARDITDYGAAEPDAGDADDIVAVEFEDDADGALAEVEAGEVGGQSGAESGAESGVESGVEIAAGSGAETAAGSGTETAAGAVVLPSAVALRDVTPEYLAARLGEHAPHASGDDLRDMVKRVSRALNRTDIAGAALERELAAAAPYPEFVKMCLAQRWRLVFGPRLRADRAAALEHMRALGLDDLVREADAGDAARKRARDEGLQPPHRPEEKRARTADPESAHATASTAATSTATTAVSPLVHSVEPKVVDLAALAFESQLLAAKVTLPKGSYQQNKKLYDVISVPAPEAPPPAATPLVRIDDMPEWARAAFPAGETASLNRIQSQVYPAAFHSDDNLLLCAPTGAGKTNVAMLALLRVLSNNRDPDTGRLALRKFKAVYIAPLKALVSEQMREFQRRLTAHYGVAVSELTGDLLLTARQIADTQVLVTTPEKWDVVTRKRRPYLDQVQLVVIDEVHLLHDERGPVLESIVVRAKRTPGTRLVGLSATLPNYHDVARFLAVPASGLFYFDARYRPCPLEQQYVGIKEKKAIRKVAAMNEACYDKVAECLSAGHQVIIFVHLRKDTVRTARWLRDRAEAAGVSVVHSDGAREILTQEAAAARNKNVGEILPSGFAVHHAGLDKADRAVVEDLFAQGHSQVLVSTATLAWGVNLPAHTVIIKGTDTYSPEKGAWVQLSPQDILQMLGRAGRPRYDKSGEGVIITAHDELQYYLAILNQQLPIESQLMARLADSVNAEVARGSVCTLSDAIDWLGETYLYIRMLQAPRLYHVGADYAGDTALVQKRADLVHSALVLLARHKLVDYDTQARTVVATELGRIAANFYISHETAAAYNAALRPWMSAIDVLSVFAASGEFKYVPVRLEEKVEVARLADQCPIPVKAAADHPHAKIAVLLQAYVSRLQLDGFALVADMVYVTQSAARLLRALWQMCRAKKWAALAAATLDLCKLVETRMWPAALPLRQFGALALPQVVRATEASHLPFTSYFSLSPEELAEAINFKGHSSEAYHLLQQYPRFEVEAHVMPVTPELVRVLMRLTPRWVWNNRVHARSERFILTLEDGNGDSILYDDTVAVTAHTVGREYVVDCVVPVALPPAPALFVAVASDRWLHSVWRAPALMYGMRLPKRPAAPTEMLDMQRVKVASLDMAVDLGATYLNRVQTQCFASLWNTNENVFIGASKGTGKTLCAQLAILGCWRQNKQRAVYLQPSQALVHARAREWGAAFAGVTDPPKVVAHLTGDVAVDARIVARSHLVLATPEQFEAVTRRWRLRRALHDLGVVVADDVHAVGANPAYEVVLARLRLMAGHLPPARLVALGAPLLYAREVAEWLGCSRDHTYNFDVSERIDPPKEIRVQPYTELADASEDAVTFARHSTECVVFVPSQKAAMEFVAELAEAGAESESVAVFHETLAHADRARIETQLRAGKLHTVVAVRATAAYAPAARDVLVLGTLRAELTLPGTYYLAELLEMVGCCRLGQVVVHAAAPQVAYYLRFLAAPMPVESSLDAHLATPFLHEIAAGTFRGKQDCVDWLTYTFFYRRLAQNSSFYGLTDVSHIGLSEFLSELVESTLETLSEDGLIEVGQDEHDEEEDEEDEEEEEEEEEAIAPLNGAMIASHYSVSPGAVKAFGQLSSKDRLRGIISAVTSVPDFDSLPVRAEDIPVLTRLGTSVPLKLSSDSDIGLPQAKAFLLLQAHLSRLPVGSDLVSDQRMVLEKMLPLVNACTDTLSSEGHLNALQAMDLSQMIVQGMWNSDSPLWQLPYTTDQTLARAKKYSVESVYDIMSLEDDERDDVLQLPMDKLNDVANFVNKYPNIDILYELNVEEEVHAGEAKDITITIERDEEMEDLAVETARFPFAKQEGWWLVIGDAATRQLYAIKKITVAHESQLVTMQFTIPTPGTHTLTVWCMCDSYIDVDKEMEVEVNVV